MRLDWDNFNWCYGPNCPVKAVYVRPGKVQRKTVEGDNFPTDEEPKLASQAMELFDTMDVVHEQEKENDFKLQSKKVERRHQITRKRFKHTLLSVSRKLL